MVWLALLSGCVTEDVRTRSSLLGVVVPGAGAVYGFRLSDGAPVGPLLEPAPVARYAPSAAMQTETGWVTTNFATGEVYAFDATGQYAATLHQNDRSQVRLEEPCALGLLGDRVAVLGNDSQNVVFMDATGEVRSELGPEVPIRQAHGLVVDAHQLYIATSAPAGPEQGLLQRWDLATGTREETFGPPGELTAAVDVDLGPDGLIYVTDYGDGRVLRYDPDVGALDAVVATGLRDPVSSAFGPEGALYVLEERGVVRVTPSTVTLVVEADSQGLAGARSLVVVPQGL